MISCIFIITVYSDRMYNDFGTHKLSTCRPNANNETEITHFILPLHIKVLIGIYILQKILRGVHKIKFYVLKLYGRPVFTLN